MKLKAYQFWSKGKYADIYNTWLKNNNYENNIDAWNYFAEQMFYEENTQTRKEIEELIKEKERGK